MEQGTAQLTAVHGPRTVNTKNGAMNVWDAQFSNNMRATIWEAPLAQIATSLVNQQVDFSYESKPNKDPQYPPNHTLKAIALSVGSAVPAQNGGAGPVIPLNQPAYTPDPRNVSAEERGERIERQSAYKAAVEYAVGFAPPGADVWEMVKQTTDAFAYYAKHGRWQDTELPVPVDAGAEEDWV